MTPIRRRPGRARYYVTQFGYVWSFSWGGMVRFLTIASSGKAWDLDKLHGRPLKGVWPSLAKTVPSTPARFRGVLFYALDKTPGEFQEALQQLRDNGEFE